MPPASACREAAPTLEYRAALSRLPPDDVRPDRASLACRAIVGMPGNSYEDQPTARFAAARPQLDQGPILGRRALRYFAPALAHAQFSRRSAATRSGGAPATLTDPHQEN